MDLLVLRERGPRTVEAPRAAVPSQRIPEPRPRTDLSNTGHFDTAPMDRRRRLTFAGILWIDTRDFLIWLISYWLITIVIALLRVEHPVFVAAKGIALWIIFLAYVVRLGIHVIRLIQQEWRG